jgi:hypothetical protein
MVDGKAEVLEPGLVHIPSAISVQEQHALAEGTSVLSSSCWQQASSPADADMAARAA